MAAPGVRRSRILLAVYVASLALVCSFILFEVLDIDGSDFPKPIARSVTAVKLTESHHDLKRVWAASPSMADRHVIADQRSDVAGRAIVARFIPESSPVPVRVFCWPVLLARSSLDAPSA